MSRPASGTSLHHALTPHTQRLSDPQDVLVHDTYDRLRSAIDSAASKYVGEHYQDGVTMTFIRTAPVEEDTAQQQTGPAEDTPASSETDGDAQATEARSDLPAVHEAHAGSAPDVDDVRRSEAALKDPAEQDVAGNAGAGRGEADSSTFATVEAAVDQAEAAAQEEFQTEQAEAHSQQEEMGDTLLSRQMAETHIGPQGAEQEVNIEATECGDPKASLGSAGMAEAEGVAEPHIPATKQIPSGAPTFTLHIVGNRYNLANYWAGRWRSTYILSLPSEHDVAQKGEITALIKGKVQIQVHYFEDGNVQLSAEHAPELPVDTSVDVTSLVTGSAEAEAYSAFAEDIVRVIKQDEQAYQAALETTLSELLECTFRALRRQLPVTKQKLDWNRVSPLVLCRSQHSC